MKPGDKVIVVFDWIGHTSNRVGFAQTISSDTVKVDGELYYKANVFPHSALADIEQVQQDRMKLKQALDDSMKLVYEICNKKSRGEYK